ncbi:MAG: hypothetical protein KDD56_04875 [Bdellovibrionales bacterium]|nr:hypothetical protein [Bdellovibrionales bacterium]
MVKKRLHKERGAELVEYAIAAAILIAVFIVAGIIIRSSSSERGEASMGIHQDAIPCGADLNGEECL